VLEADDCKSAQRSIVQIHYDSVSVTAKKNGIVSMENDNQNGGIPESIAKSSLIAAGGSAPFFQQTPLSTEIHSTGEAGASTSSSFSHAMKLSKSATSTQKNVQFETRCQGVAQNVRIGGLVRDEGVLRLSNEEAGLSRAIERVLLMDDAVLRRVQRSMQVRSAFRLL
jgi:hypothetical protein